MRVSCQIISIVALLVASSQCASLVLPLQVDSNVGATSSTSEVTDIVPTTSSVTGLVPTTNGVTELVPTTSDVTDKVGGTTHGLTAKLNLLPVVGRLTHSLFGRSPHTIGQLLSTSEGLKVEALDTIFSELDVKVRRRGFASPFGVFQNFAPNLPAAGSDSNLLVVGSVLPVTGSLLSNNPAADAVPSMTSIPVVSSLPLSSLPVASAPMFRGVPEIFQS